MPAKNDVVGKQKKGTFRRKVKASYKLVKARLKDTYSKSVPVTADNSRAASFLSEAGDQPVEPSQRDRLAFASQLDLKLKSHLGKKDTGAPDEQPLAGRSVDLEHQDRLSNSFVAMTSAKRDEAEAPNTGELSGSTSGPVEAVLEREHGSVNPGEGNTTKENISPTERASYEVDPGGLAAGTVGCQTLPKTTSARNLDAIFEAPRTQEDTLLGETQQPLFEPRDGVATNDSFVASETTEIAVDQEGDAIGALSEKENITFLDEERNTLSQACGQAWAATDISINNGPDENDAPEPIVNGNIMLFAEERKEFFPMKAQTTATAETVTIDADKLGFPSREQMQDNDGREQTSSTRDDRGPRPGRASRVLSVVNRTVPVCVAAALAHAVLSRVADR